mgnify:CR=1 FL=1
MIMSNNKNTQNGMGSMHLSTTHEIKNERDHLDRENPRL